MTNKEKNAFMVINGATTGFSMRFENGVTVSVQFGTGSYSNKGETTAEVAVWNDEDVWFIMDDKGELSPVENETDVMGWCTTETVANIINQASTL